MTVGAVIVPASAAEAVADAAGRAAVRRIVDAAWAGGAMPIIVVAADPEEVIATVLVGSPAALSDRDDGVGEVGSYRSGAVSAAASVQGTSAVLLWPGHMTWVDPETVTSLIEAHGRAGAATLRPAHEGKSGWPVLVPVAGAASLLATDGPDLEGVLAAMASDVTVLKLGDPGSVIGIELSLDELPGFQGPPEPVGGPPPEWGAAVAEDPDPEAAE